MIDYMKEQFVVILTTTLSLITAWSWNLVYQQYMDEYYGHTLGTRVIFATIILIITFFLINWLLQNFKLHEQKLAKVRRSDLKSYVDAAVAYPN